MGEPLAGKLAFWRMLWVLINPFFGQILALVLASRVSDNTTRWPRLYLCLAGGQF